MPEISPSLDREWWRSAQSRLFIRGCPKRIAADARLALDSIYRYGRADYAVPAHQLFLISAVQADFSYAQFLAEKVGTLLSLPPPLFIHRPTILLLADLALSFGEFFQLAEKIQKEEPLSHDEMRRLEKGGEKVKASVDALIQRARKQRKEQEAKQ